MQLLKSSYIPKVRSYTNLEATGEEFQFGIKLLIIVKPLQSS